MYVVDNLYISLLPSATTIWSSFNYLSKSASWNTWNGSWPDISVQGAWQQIHNSTLYHINFTNVWSENSDLPSCKWSSCLQRDLDSMASFRRDPKFSYVVALGFVLSIVPCVCEAIILTKLCWHYM